MRVCEWDMEYSVCLPVGSLSLLQALGKLSTRGSHNDENPS